MFWSSVLKTLFSCIGLSIWLKSESPSPPSLSPNQKDRISGRAILGRAPDQPRPETQRGGALIIFLSIWWTGIMVYRPKFVPPEGSEACMSIHSRNRTVGVTYHLQLMPRLG